MVCCELSGSGVLACSSTAAVERSYVRLDYCVEPIAVVSLEHDACSLDKGGPQHGRA